MRALNARTLAKQKELELLMEDAVATGVVKAAGIEKGEAPASGAYQGPVAGQGGVKAMRAAAEARSKRASEPTATAVASLRHKNH